MMKHFCSLISFFVLIASIFPRTNAAGLVSNGVQSHIVEFFSANNCPGVRSLIKAEDAFSVRPNIMAIVAYCEIPGVDSLKLFQKAEELDPTGDLIATLHAKYVWRKDRVAAEPLWEKVQMLARNPYLVNIADEYLSGMITVDKPMSLKTTTFYENFLVGGSTESNSRPSELAYSPNASSPSINLSGRMNVQHWYPFGSLSANYFVSVNQRPLANQFNSMTHDLDIPIAIHAGKNEDIAFRPIGGVSTIGGNLFKSKGGLGVLGIIYRPNYKQSVQGMVYSDHIYLKEIKGEDADHFHFDYMWEFYPKGWIFSTQISIEHAKAENTSDYAGIPGDFNNAHTDTQIDVNLQKDFLIFTLGLSSKLMYRLDTGDSTYALHSTGALVKKTRSDTEIMATPNISIPIFKDVQLYGWYSIDKVSSNIGKNDYIDRNFFNQVVGLAIKTTLSSY